MRTALALIPCVLACTTDEPVAPTISELTYNPTTITVGQQATVTGTVRFDDPDGDVAQLGIEIVLPNQQHQNLPLTDVQGLVGMMTEGTIGWAIIVVPPLAGRYGFSLWITDSEANASNKLDGSLMAQ
jgi:hypothetical protein